MENQKNSPKNAFQHKRQVEDNALYHLNQALNHCCPLSLSARIKLANRLKCNPKDLFRS